jgi:hypothetical protein
VDAGSHLRHQVCKRSELDPPYFAIARARSAVAAIAVYLAFYSAAAPVVGGAVAQGESGRNSAQTSGAPVITATPDHVAVTDRPGSTEIQWDTGNGSVGFVFVTASDRKPVLFATGAKGSRVAPWIRAGNYAFELYGDDQRRTLLAAVTVSGTTESDASPRAMLLRSKARWLLVVALIAIVYIAVYLSSTGALRTTFPAEPTTSPRPLHVGRNLLLGIAAFVSMDGIIFHTGLYVSILAPDSYAGRLAVITRSEKQRPSSGLKEVLVLGDSRMAEGFSTTVADELGSAAGLKFVNLAEPASSVNTWYYMLREVDPASRRYSAIIVPYGIGYEPSTADPLRISMAAPLLRYRDSFDFASGFQRWSGRFRAFTTCILRGLAYQSDVADLLEHPIARIKSVQQEPNRMQSRAAYKGRDYDLVGTTYDSKTGHVTFAPQLTETQRQAIRKSLVRPSQSEMQYSMELQREWIPRILNRYSKSPTAIVLTPVPRGPFRELTGFSMAYHTFFPHLVTQRSVLSVPEQTFDFLEKPEYYFDAYHLNAKGRARFTETLVAEVVGRLGMTDSHARSNSKSKLATDGAVGRMRGSGIWNSSSGNTMYSP